MAEPRATRHVTKRDGRLEGEPNIEPTTPEKENQRDLTSLSGPEPGVTRRSRGADR